MATIAGVSDGPNQPRLLPCGECLFVAAAHEAEPPQVELYVGWGLLRPVGVCGGGGTGSGVCLWLWGHWVWGVLVAVGMGLRGWVRLACRARGPLLRLAWVGSAVVMLECMLCVLVRCAGGATTGFVRVTHEAEGRMHVAGGLHADSIIGHTGGETSSVNAHQSSIALVNCTFSNIFQRASFIDYSPNSGEYGLTGVFVATSPRFEETSITVQVSSSLLCGTVTPSGLGTSCSQSFRCRPGSTWI